MSAATRRESGLLVPAQRRAEQRQCAIDRRLVCRGARNVGGTDRNDGVARGRAFG